MSSNEKYSQILATVLSYGNLLQKSRIQSIFFAVSACLQGLAVKRRLSRDGPAKDGGPAVTCWAESPQGPAKREPLKSFFRFIEEFQRSEWSSDIRRVLLR
ncbi:hypothetical protein CEXT_102171 [Caerostris extrusa]|uniref:Uncharacterized protein n=1 Tax=Caerostris extrusa TaxID=172846 RepID=A0AAV4PCP0_CAEEX|nr:hypothetical protein CEXT_102171 [Caerostris extrusa]